VGISRTKLERLTRNLGALGFLRLALRKAVAPALFPGAHVSYSQFGEDACIDHVLGWPDTGFYVDVGCNDPRIDSVTYGFYERGWSGIAIDANPAFAPLYRKLRPNDRFVTALVSRCPEPIEFVQFAESRVSSVSPAHVAEWAQRSPITARTVVKPRTLDSILLEHGCPERFDLLTIDVEGHDLAVLESLDIERFRPRCVLVEIHGLFNESLEQNAIVQHLRRHTYGLVTASGFTAIFVDSAN
jgi:FkbM family methyltransferase